MTLDTSSSVRLAHLGPSSDAHGFYFQLYGDSTRSLAWMTLDSTTVDMVGRSRTWYKATRTTSEWVKTSQERSWKVFKMRT